MVSGNSTVPNFFHYCSKGNRLHLSSLRRFDSEYEEWKDANELEGNTGALQVSYHGSHSPLEPLMFQVVLYTSKIFVTNQQ